MLGLVEWKDAIERFKINLVKSDLPHLTNSKALCILFGDKIMHDHKINLGGFSSITAIENFLYALAKSFENLPSNITQRFDEIFKILLSMHTSLSIAFANNLIHLIINAPDNVAVWLPLLHSRYTKFMKVTPTTLNDEKFLNIRIFNTNDVAKIHDSPLNDSSHYVSFVEYDKVPLALLSFDAINNITLSDDADFLKKTLQEHSTYAASYPDQLFRSKRQDVYNNNLLTSGQKSVTGAWMPIMAALKMELEPALYFEMKMRVAHFMLKNFQHSFIPRQMFLMLEKIKKVATLLPEEIIRELQSDECKKLIDSSILSQILNDLEALKDQMKLPSRGLHLTPKDPSGSLKNFFVQIDKRVYVAFREGKKLFEIRLDTVNDKEQINWKVANEGDRLKIQYIPADGVDKNENETAAITAMNGDSLLVSFEGKGKGGVKIEVFFHIN